MHVSRNQVKSLFLNALENSPPDSWESYLNEACGGDDELHGRVRALLDAHQNADDFVKESAPTTAFGNTAAPTCENRDTVIGPYRLMERIAEGGMGIVFVAEQTEPVRRRVALKLIKPGLDTRQVVARFEAERQALAMMDHPNIARVFDGGMTPSGRPYFVMELVRGLPITEYCDRERLSIRDRLDLFVLVCRAVQHAHQKGVIHRDLKPSNVLVTEIDGAAVPKVIDFGVAKAIGGQLADSTVYTGFHQMLGTPLYMSPEQADVSGVDVDTRSDVYALGVLLYELLTGTTPFDRETFRTAALDEVRRILREVDPPRPSTRLNSLGASRTTVSANRRSDVRHLDRTVCGELDWIVMKALDKDRRRRYETANDFASDVMRYLTDQPVEACPPSVGYRLSKFARRNRAALTTGSLVAFALVAGLAGSLWQAARATRAGQEARRSAAETEAILGFLISDLLQGSDPEKALGRDVRVAEVLANAVAKVDTAFPGQPVVEAGVRHALGRAYHALGRYEEAWHHTSRAHELRVVHLGAEHRETLQSQLNLADLLNHRGEVEESRRLSERTLETQRRVLDAEHQDTLTSMHNLAGILSDHGNHPEAVRLYEQVIESRRRAFGPEHRDTLKAMHGLASTLEAQGYLRPASELRDQVLEARRRVLGSLHPDSLSSIAVLADSLHDEHKYEEAHKLVEELVESRRQILGPEHTDTLHSMQSLADLLDHLDRRDESEALYQKTIETQHRILGPEHPETLSTQSSLGVLFLNQGKLDQARQVLEKTLASRCRVLGPEHIETVGTMQNLSNVLNADGDLSGSLKLDEQILEIRQRTLGEQHPATLMALNNLAGSLARAGRFADALPLAERNFEGRRRVFGPSHPETLAASRNLALLRSQHAGYLARPQNAQVRVPALTPKPATKK